MIVKRFIAVFLSPCRVRGDQADHDRRSRCRDRITFRTDGKVLVAPGWLAVYGRKPGVAGRQRRSGSGHVTEGEICAAIEDQVEVEDKQTNPPARYTESTLLSAMEGAGKLVDDDELREAMSERGLGTPATRAAIIERTPAVRKYVARDGRDLNVTGKGLRLIELARGHANAASHFSFDDRRMGGQTSPDGKRRA